MFGRLGELLTSPLKLWQREKPEAVVFDVGCLEAGVEEGKGKRGRESPGEEQEQRKRARVEQVLKAVGKKRVEREDDGDDRARKRRYVDVEQENEPPQVNGASVVSGLGALFKGFGKSKDRLRHEREQRRNERSAWFRQTLQEEMLKNEASTKAKEADEVPEAAVDEDNEKIQPNEDEPDSAPESKNESSNMRRSFATPKRPKNVPEELLRRSTRSSAARAKCRMNIQMSKSNATSKEEIDKLVRERLVKQEKQVLENTQLRKRELQQRAQDEDRKNAEKERLRERIRQKVIQRIHRKSAMEIVLEFAHTSKLNSASSSVQIRRSLKRVMTKYHPDRTLHKSLAEIVEAEEIFKVLQDTYQQLDN